MENFEYSFLAGLEKLSNKVENMANFESSFVADPEKLYKREEEDLDTIKADSKAERYLQKLEQEALLFDSDRIMKGKKKKISIGSMQTQTFKDTSGGVDDRIMKCIRRLSDIEKETITLHDFVRYHYRLRFPDLETLVPHPVEYARLLRKIGNQKDLSVVHACDKVLDLDFQRKKILEFLEGKTLPPDLSAIVARHR